MHPVLRSSVRSVRLIASVAVIAAFPRRKRVARPGSVRQPGTAALQEDSRDPFHGIDVDAHFQKAAERLAKATSWGQANGVIAQALLEFNDSHLYYVPPSRAARVNYGWTPVIVGNQCFVSSVRPKGVAAAQGLAPGDEILSLQGVKPTRSELWKMTYFFYTLNPGVPMKLSVKSPKGEVRQVVIEPKIEGTKRSVNLYDEMDLNELLRGLEDEDLTNRFEKLGDVVIWKMQTFQANDVDEFDRLVDEKVKGSALILDLRGNGGGYVEPLEHLVAKFFDREVKIADVQGRKAGKPMVSTKRRGATFQGKLVVLIDAASGSAAELFARVIQLEKRGTVLGDRSSGSVMQAEYYSGEMGGESVILWGASITDANLIMADGKSLEHVGVTPDQVLLPTAEDMAAGRDPVLSAAAALVGQSLDPQKAGKMFAVRWR